MHIGTSQLSPGGVLVTKHHLPTARMPVEGVLWFCLHQLGIEPERDDWKSVLAKTEKDFHDHAAWTGLIAPTVTNPES